MKIPTLFFLKIKKEILSQGAPFSQVNKLLKLSLAALFLVGHLVSIFPQYLPYPLFCLRQGTNYYELFSKHRPKL